MLKNYFYLLAIVGILIITIPVTSAAGEWRISAFGYGPIRAGMTINQAEKLLGTRLHGWENTTINSDCDELFPKSGHKGVSFMVQAGIITYAYTDTKGVHSDSGIAVGDYASKLKILYGNKLEIEPHKYNEGDFYYFVWQKNHEHGIKYEVDSKGIVYAIYGGDGTIELVEGCS